MGLELMKECIGKTVEDFRVEGGMCEDLRAYLPKLGV